MASEIKKRLDRIVEILIQLQSRRLIRAQDLADHFQVSLRTIYRDIKSLEQAGVPLIGEAGLGYSLADGYRLPPITFSREEALSFASTEKIIHQYLDEKTKRLYQSAIAKIRAVLNSGEIDMIDTVDRQIIVSDRGPALFPDQVPHVLSSTIEAIASRKQLRLGYQGIRDSRPQTRLIEPIGILHEIGFWYIVAYCLERKDLRQFRSDRVHDIELLSSRFVSHHGTMADFIARRKQQYARPLSEVRILVDKAYAHYMHSQRHHYGFIREEVHDTQVEMVFACGDIQQALPRWLLMFADKIDIVSPDQLRENLQKLMETICTRTGLKS